MPPNMSLEPRESTGIPVRASGTNGLRLTPSVGAFEWLVTPVGIRSSIESIWERSSPPRTRDFAAPSRSAARWRATGERWRVEAGP